MSKILTLAKPLLIFYKLKIEQLSCSLRGVYSLGLKGYQLSSKGVLMKFYAILLLGLLLGSTAARADNRNWYCGQGSDKYSADDAALSLVVQDGRVRAYEKERTDAVKATLIKDYNFKALNGGYVGTPKNGSPNGGEATMTFSVCSENNTATVELSGPMAPTATLPCTCEAE
jgi:hypothetical protein